MKPSISQLLLLVLALIIGSVFLFSAWSKTEPIAYFEYTIQSQLPVSAWLAAFMARFFIGLEAALGILFVVNIPGYKKWVPKVSLGLLLLFSLHLVYLWIRQGNDVNCGCMGVIAPMSPFQSLLKNLGLMLGILLWQHYYDPKQNKLSHLISAFLPLVLIALPFFLYPVSGPVSLPISKMYSPDQEEQPLTELRQGKHVLSFMSLGCRHCRHAATLLQEMKTNNPELPFYIVFPKIAGDTLAAGLSDFIEATHISTIPYHFLKEKDYIDFIKASGSDGIPVILWMKDTHIVRKITIPELNQKELEQWLKE